MITYGSSIWSALARNQTLSFKYSLCEGPAAVLWAGAFGGWWRVDPNDNSVPIFRAHNMLDLEQLVDGVGLGVYEAIAKFQAFASLSPG